MTAPVELIIVERAGVRLGVPASRVAAVADLPPGMRSVVLQQRLGQPPLTTGERCFGLRLDTARGETVVTVAGRVSIASVTDDDIAPLPALLAGAAPVHAVVFDGDASVLVLDVDAMIEHARATPGAP